MKKKSATVILLSLPSHYLLKLKSNPLTDPRTSLLFPPVGSLPLGRCSPSEHVANVLFSYHSWIINFQSSLFYSTFEV